MKIAVFSDVHGNLKALKTTLEQIKEKSPDLTIFLGDIFQRGNEETECLELLKASGIICLQMQFIRQMPLFYETDCCGHMIRFSHFLFSDIHSDYPFLQLSSLKNGGFDRACQSEEVLGYELVVVGHSHRNLEKGNVVSVSATGLEGASYLLIDVNESAVSFERFFIDVFPEQEPGISENIL